MNRTLLSLAALLLSGSPLPAQVSCFNCYSLAPALTTGAVGLAASQTAQITVVNLNTSTTSTPTAACYAQLEFWDSQGRMVKSLFFPNIAAGATASLQIKLAEVATSTAAPLRTQIRGLVRRMEPPPQTGVTTPPTPVTQPIAFYSLGCALATTLEIFDTATGVTQTLTSDLHTLENFPIVPLPAFGR